MPRLTDKTELTASPANDDLAHIVDVSDVTGSAAGTSKKIQMSNLSPITKSSTTLSPRTAGDSLAMGTGDVTADSIKINDTDDSNTLEVVWNENDSSNRTLNVNVAGGDRTLTFNENLTVGNGCNVSITAEDNNSAVVLDNANFEVENTNATQRDMKLVHGTDANATLTIEGSNSVINQDVTSDGSPTFSNVDVTTKATIGSNTEISESSGDTLIENTSSAKTINIKLGDLSSVTKIQVLASDDTVVSTINSIGDGSFSLNQDSVLEIRNASGISKILFNSNGKNYINDGNTGFLTTNANTTIDNQGGLTVHITTVNAATYDLLVTDYIVHVTYTATGAVTSLTLPSAQVVSGRYIIIKDAGYNAGTNTITIDTEGAETIEGETTDIINIDGDFRVYYSDGTNWISLYHPSYIGEMYVKDNAAATTINTQNVWEEIDTIATSGTLRGWTQATGDLTAGNGAHGLYQVNCSISTTVAIANKDVEFAISINNTIQNNVIGKRRLATTDTGSISLNGIITIADGDVVKLEVRNLTDTTDITVIHANVTLHKI